MSSDVLIVGAGPTGMVLALFLNKLGVRVRIIDKAAESGTTSRALAIQARTLELYRQIDLGDEVFQRAHKTPAVNFWARGARAASIPFERVGEGLTPYPYLMIYPQDAHERLLSERLHAVGIDIERRTELLSFEQRGTAVVARIRRPDGSEQSCEASYLAGCDGAHSVVREQIGSGFPGGTYRQLFYVADVAASGATIDGQLHVDLDEADFLAVFPLPESGRARLIGTVRDERADHPDTLTFDDVSGHALQSLEISIREVNWFSTYRVHHRVTDHFRRDRAFLLGDAAHIHSPAGGQGMNTGIGDAVNLAWKLAAATRGSAPESLLDSYEAERRPFAQRLVATTDRAFSFATAEGPIADIVRTRIAPLVLPALARFEAARDFAFRTVSQLTLNYRGGPLSAGRAGQIQGGDRLPWAAGPDHDNYHWVSTQRWQAHVYGEARQPLREWCRARELPLHEIAWQREHEQAGLTRDALYLVRPDSYIGLVDPQASRDTAQRYLDERGSLDKLTRAPM
jgi:2-polyprenyl-6-methoxyphenol hydroxylase-like FAD-dependent oxidoreductase